MKAADIEFTKALRTGRTDHLDLIWNEREFIRRGVNPTVERQHARGLARTLEKEASIARVINRDPCPVCGTRMDIPHTHRGAQWPNTKSAPQG